MQTLAKGCVSDQLGMSSAFQVVAAWHSMLLYDTNSICMLAFLGSSISECRTALSHLASKSFLSRLMACIITSGCVKVTRCQVNKSLTKSLMRFVVEQDA